MDLKYTRCSVAGPLCRNIYFQEIFLAHLGNFHHCTHSHKLSNLAAPSVLGWVAIGEAAFRFNFNTS